MIVFLMLFMTWFCLRASYITVHGTKAPVRAQPGISFARLSHAWTLADPRLRPAC